MNERDYPDTVIEILSPTKRFRPASLKAVREFAERRPWSGTVEERKQKFRFLNRALAAAYDIHEPELVFETIDGRSSSGASYYVPSQHQIHLVGRLSVVTYLHEFAHSMGHDERKATRWSVNLFRRCFPQQFARLIHRGHMLLRPEDAADLAGTESAP